MTGKSRLELAVGIFIVVGLIIFVSFVFLVRDFQIVKPGYKFDIIFGFANGLKVGSPARLAGVDVGEVKSSEIFFDQASSSAKVRVKVWVKKDARIPVDSQFWINTLGLLGEKYLEIMPGKDYQTLVKENDGIAGSDPVPMDEITKETKKLVLQIEEAVNSLNTMLAQVKSGEGTLGKFFYDETVYKNIEGLTEDLRRHPWKLFWKTKEKPVKKQIR